MRKEHCALPEEFYTQTNLPVVTPHKYSAVLEMSLKYRCVLWSRYARTARCSLVIISFPFGEVTVLPVDRCFGSDVASPSHQRMLLEGGRECKPFVTLFEPRCKYLSQAGFARDPAKTKSAGEAELLMLRFLGNR